jgi:transcriptional regulator with XRE-family HTH domain
MLGQVLRINRETGRWTQEKLADRSGCTSSYISEIENGRADLSVKMADRLCKAMTVSTGCLLYEAEILTQQFRQTEPHHVHQDDWADPNVARQWLTGEHIRSLSNQEAFLTDPAAPWLILR